MHRKIAPMARPVTLFTGQWADLPLEELAEKAGRLGLRRPRARLLGRPLRGRPGARRGRLRRPHPGDPRAQPPELLRARRAPRRAGGVRPDRRPPPRDPAAGRLGRRRSGGRPAARGREDERHGAGGGEVRRPAGERLHRLGDLAHALFLPAERLRRDRARLRGLRRALVADHRRLRRGGRQVRARGPPDRDRLRLRHHAEDARRDRQPRGLRDQPRPVPLRAPVPRHRAVRARVPRTGSTTSTSRTRASGWTGGGRSSARTSTSARRRAAGTSSRPATATSTSRSSSAR